MAPMALLALVAGLGAAQRIELLEIPDPDLSGLSPSLRDSLESVLAETRAQDAEKRPSQEVGEAFGQLGLLLHAYGFYEAADAAYRNAGLLLPQDPRWPYYLGGLTRQGGRLEEAARFFEQALELGGDRLPSLLHLGAVRYELGDEAGSVEAYEAALELDGDSAAALAGLGRAALAGDRPEEAVARFERALELQPQATAMYVPLAMAYRKLGLGEKARQLLEQRGDRQVGFSDPLVNRLQYVEVVSAMQTLVDLAAGGEEFSMRDFLGFATSYLGPLEGSAQVLDTLLERSAAEGSLTTVQRARLCLAAAAILNHQGRPEEGRRRLRAALELDDDFAAAHFELAASLSRDRQFEEAIQHYRRVQELDPDHPEASIQMAVAELALGRNEQAVVELRKVLAKDADSALAHLHLFTALQRLERPVEAQQHLRRALDLDLPPLDSFYAHRQAARIAEEQGRPDEAVAQLSAAVELGSEDPEVRVDLAALLARLGRFEEALPHYDRVVEQEPQNEAARLGQVSVAVLLGRHQQVLNDLEAGILVLPDSVPLRHLLARCLAALPEEDLRNGERSLELATGLLENAPSATLEETIAMAMAEVGRLEEAARLQRRLVSLAEAAGQEQVAANLRANLDLYERGRPCCARQDWRVLLSPLKAGSGGRP